MTNKVIGLVKAMLGFGLIYTHIFRLFTCCCIVRLPYNGFRTIVLKISSIFEKLLVFTRALTIDLHNYITPAYIYMH